MKRKRRFLGGINARIINNLTGGQRFRLPRKERSFRTVGRVSLLATLHLFPDQRAATHVTGTENEASAF